MVVLEWTAQPTCRTPPGVERSSGPSQRGTQSSAGSAPEISHHHSHVTPMTTVELHLLNEPFTHSMAVISWFGTWNQPPPQSHYTCLLNHSHTTWQSSAGSALQPSPQSHYSCSLNHLQKELVFGNKDSHKIAGRSASKIHKGTFL